MAALFDLDMVLTASMVGAALKKKKRLPRPPARPAGRETHAFTNTPHDVNDSQGQGSVASLGGPTARFILSINR